MGCPDCARLTAELDVVRGENAALDTRLKECQRKGQRRADQIIGLIDKNGALQAEIGRLERKLIGIYKYCKPDAPREGAITSSTVREIVRKAIPSKIKSYEERRNGS